MTIVSLAMNQHTSRFGENFKPIDAAKFVCPDLTAKGERRARVALRSLDTLWFNTGTLCNITCANCYIESSPRNDRLAYMTLAEVEAILDDLAGHGLATGEIGFTGGEPFMNKQAPAMMACALERGFQVLVLTNAMQPMQRPAVEKALLDMRARHGERLTLRVSLDHHSPQLHEKERGPGTFDVSLAGIDWLARSGFSLAIAGRTCWGESEAEARAGYARLFAERGWPVDADDPARLILFPEMDEAADVPEITVNCWKILGKDPGEVMCATSRMVVKPKELGRPVFMPCTLLPYGEAFRMGGDVAAMLNADGGNFERGAVKLNHPHCARFCVLGGGSCSA